MQSKLGCDLAQRERPHRQIPVFEEIALSGNYRLGHPLNGEKALLKIAHQPTRFLQMLG